MKRIIALVLVLVMVLSLSTVAFAAPRTLTADVWNVVCRVFKRSPTIYYRENTLADLTKTVLDYQDTVVAAIGQGIRHMADSFGVHLVRSADSVLGKKLALGASWCIGHVAVAVEYVYRTELNWRTQN